MGNYGGNSLLKPKVTPMLTDTAIRKTKPSEKPVKLADSGGLFLLLNPNGSRWWRYKYRFGGKEKLLSLGTYPDTGLKEARDYHSAARKLLATGIDPSEHRKATKAAGEEKAANSFEIIAREWFGKQSKTWAVSHSSKIMLRLEKDLFPWLGARPIADITAPEILSCLRRVESRGAVESSHRILQNCGQIMRYAIATGRAMQNPADALKGALAPVQATHRAAITEPKAIGALLRAIDDYHGALITKSALKMAPLVFVRPGELRQAEWAEIDLDKAQWNIPAEKMKTREAHLVPLSTQAVAILTELAALTGRARFVFPSARTPKRPMSNNAILAALRRMGYAKDEMSGHGFRAMARTILDEILHVRPDYIEHQLAHAVLDPNGRAYNRTAHLAERIAMMQQWADYLDTLRAFGDNVAVMRYKAA
jgi:integrase